MKDYINLAVMVKPNKWEKFHALLLATKHDTTGDEGLIEYESVFNKAERIWIPLRQIEIKTE